MDNPKIRQAWILEQLTAEPLLSFGECFSRFSVEFSKTERTFVKDWKLAAAAHSERMTAINEAIEAEVVKESVKVAKKALKTKNDRLLVLQSQVDECLSELKIGTTVDSKMRSGKVVKFTRDFTVLERTQLRKTIKDLQGEISKMQGDYAPMKVETTVGIPFTPIPDEMIK